MQTYMSPQEVRQDLPRGRVVCILSWPFQPERAQASEGMKTLTRAERSLSAKMSGKPLPLSGLASAALAARRQLYMTQNTETKSFTILTHQIAMHHKNKNFIILRSRIIKFLLPINNKLNLVYNSENQWKDARWDQQIANKNSSTENRYKIIRAFLMFFLFTTN